MSRATQTGSENRASSQQETLMHKKHNLHNSCRLKYRKTQMKLQTVRYMRTVLLLDTRKTFMSIATEDNSTYRNLYYCHLTKSGGGAPFLEVLQYQVNPWRRWSKPLTTPPRFKNQFNIEAPV